MPRKPIDKELKGVFRKAFCARVKKARLDAVLSQQQIATALGIDKDTYKQYESRSEMPLYLVDRFSIIVRKDPLFLIFGKLPERRFPIMKFPFKNSQ